MGTSLVLNPLSHSGNSRKGLSSGPKADRPGHRFEREVCGLSRPWRLCIQAELRQSRDARQDVRNGECLWDEMDVSDWSGCTRVWGVSLGVASTKPRCRWAHAGKDPERAPVSSFFGVCVEEDSLAKEAEKRGIGTGKKNPETVALRGPGGERGFLSRTQAQGSGKMAEVGDMEASHDLD